MTTRNQVCWELLGKGLAGDTCSGSWDPAPSVLQGAGKKVRAKLRALGVPAPSPRGDQLSARLTRPSKDNRPAYCKLESTQKT